MNSTGLKRGGRLMAAIGLAALMVGALPSQAAPWDGKRDEFADPGFESVWTRTDADLVRGGRSWYWGPKPWFDYAEFYRQGINGLRTVQYFDKARMEINNPNDRSYQSGVTNGLLVVELVSGHLKRGNDPFDYTEQGRATVPVAGDPPEGNTNAPTYASFGGVATVDNNNYRDPARLNELIGTTLDKSGNLGFRQDLARPETKIVQYNSITGHNIPSMFWDFLNLQGPYLEDGVVKNGTVVDWTFAMGLPISDAYWTRVRIGGVEKDVLVQLFERRVLTYVPDNPQGYKVEMGNVGQHYFQWRYPQLGQAWAAPDGEPPLLYATNENTGGHWEINQWEFGANLYIRLTSAIEESVPFSYRRSYEPSRTRVLFDSRRGDRGHRQIYEMDAPTIYGQSGDPGIWRITYSDGGSVPNTAPPQGYIPPEGAHDYNPSASPDASKMVFVSDRDGVPQLYITNADGANPQRLTSDGCTDQVPSWSPDGRSLYWEQQCGDTFAILRADLSYQNEDNFSVSATLVNIQELTPRASNNRFPRVSPDGSKVVFTSYRDGNAEIYVINANGTDPRRLTNSPAEDEAATWSAGGNQLAFASNRDGDYEIFLMNYDGSSQTQLTNNSADDRWAMWAQ